MTAASVGRVAGRYRAAAARPSAATAPASLASEPRDAVELHGRPKVDFLAIDDPQEVALLPSLDPAVQIAMWTAFTAGAMAGIPHVSLTVSGTVASRDMSIAYDMDRSRMTSEGFIGSAHVAERSGEPPASSPSIHVTGKIGSSREEFDISVQPDGYHLDGTFGTIPVHVAASFEEARDSDSEDPRFLVLRGTVGDQPYELRADLPATGEEPRASLIRAEGHLGDQAIQKTYQVVASPEGTLSVEATGTLGSFEQSMQLTLTPAP